MADTAPPRAVMIVLARLIEEVSGNVVSEGQYPYLEELAAKRAQKCGFSDLGLYIQSLAQGGLDREWRYLLPEITIKESFLFRIPEQFRALDQEILPEIVRKRPKDQPIRVWSAGCARGEEPSTLAVVLAENPFLTHRPWEILATDIDSTALDEARLGIYGPRSVAQVPPDYLETHFQHPKPDQWILREELRRQIQYRTFNFMSSPYSSLGDPFDVIFLRNVLIYFNPEAQRQVIARVIRRLAPDGYLFLGHSESMWQLSEEMKTIELDGCFAYRPIRSDEDADARPAGRAARRKERRRTSPDLRAAVAEALPLQASASERNTQNASVQRAPAGDTIPVPKAPEPSPIYSVRPPSRRGENRIDAAARALSEDRIDRARELLQDGLVDHKTDAVAHALRGLIHDLDEEADDAVNCYRAALFLEPRLFQVRFLLAGLLERLGWRARARCEYREVLSGLGDGRTRKIGHRITQLPDREEIAAGCRKALARLQ